MREATLCTTRAHKSVLTSIAVIAVLGVGGYVSDANACGCFSPPAPVSSEEEFAVSQQSEQIIFEVEEGYITAHVLIRYTGEPEQFAWIVPVPAVPELSLSASLAFDLVAQTTEPNVSTNTESLCPSREHVCKYHEPCPVPEPEPYPTADAGYNEPPNQDASTADSPNSPSADGVVVHSRAQIGAYETITFGAEEADAAVLWLQREGFIVNDTMSPYMQPYLDAGMVFVASRLVAGAGIDAIKPLKMRFEADKPMIPLQLTAVAAEPHLTVTAYIFSGGEMEPVDHPLVELDAQAIAVDTTGRINYPMVMARAIDDVGGDGFVMEYSKSWPSIPYPNSDSQCCGSGGDPCGIGLDGSCQCPGDDFDREDCAEEEELVEGVALVKQLRRHPHLTRLTTRLSPEEMTFDPAFARSQTPNASINGALVLRNTLKTLRSCTVDVIDNENYATLEATQACSAMYCGPGSECTLTAQNVAGCSCASGFVARTFEDLDGKSSITCVPERGTVDLAAGGLVLRNSCDGVECGAGTCVDINGFPTCRCDPDATAIEGDGTTPVCEPSVHRTNTPGARDYTPLLEEVRVCAPRPSWCGQYGWLVPNPRITRQGVVCASSMPRPGQLEIPPEPVCDGDGMVDSAETGPDSYPEHDNGHGSTAQDAGTSNSETAVDVPLAEERSGGCSTPSGTPSSSVFVVLLMVGGLLGLLRRV